MGSVVIIKNKHSRAIKRIRYSRSSSDESQNNYVLPKISRKKATFVFIHTLYSCESNSEHLKVWERGKILTGYEVNHRQGHHHTHEYMTCQRINHRDDCIQLLLINFTKSDSEYRTRNSYFLETRRVGSIILIQFCPHARLRAALH